MRSSAAMFEMQRKWVFAGATMLMVTQLNALGDWKSELARKTCRKSSAGRY
jgi:hypothetical protein